jgi:hypothetical protein
VINFIVHKFIFIMGPIFAINQVDISERAKRVKFVCFAVTLALSTLPLAAIGFCGD